MFKLQTTASYWWPVPIPVAVDGGTFEEHVLSLKFKRMTAPEHEALFEETHAKGLGDIEVSQRLLLDWRDVVDEDDKPVPYTAEAFAKLCSRFPGAAGNVVRVYLSTHGKISAKNW